MFSSTIITDVAIVGGGLAGMYAALAAKQRGCKVIIVCKERVGRSGASLIAQTVHRVSYPTESDLERYYKFMEESGRYIGDKDLLKVLITEGKDYIQKIKDLGVGFEEGHELLPNSGRIIRYACVPRRGRILTLPVLSNILKSDIQLMEKVMAIDLLSNNDIVYGLTCAAGNEIINVYAKAVIMATGGLGRIYSETTDPKDITADGLAMAYRAGVQLTGVEFIQFYPYRLGYPKILDLNPAIFDDGAIFVNKDGKRFMETYSRGEQENRDILAREMFKQKDVFLELKEMDIDKLTRYPELYRLVKKTQKRKLKMKVAAHFSMGGILADSFGRTNLQGLYACGECMGGLHGANRLAGSALVECAVFGFRTGNAAAEYALSIRHNLSLKTPNKTNMPSLGSDNIEDIVSGLRKTMWRYAGVMRDDKGLKVCREILLKLNDELFYIKPPFYRQWFELKNMIQIANLIVEAAALRKETRGSHYRIDFSEENPCARKSLIEKGKNIMFQL